MLAWVGFGPDAPAGGAVRWELLRHPALWEWGAVPVRRDLLSWILGLSKGVRTPRVCPCSSGVRGEGRGDGHTCWTWAGLRPAHGLALHPTCGTPATASSHSCFLLQVPQDEWSGYPAGKDGEIPCRRMRSGSYIKAMGDEDSADSDISSKVLPRAATRRDSYRRSSSADQARTK